MARIRTIKPEFFTSEDIVELTPLARLLYIGMWCEADREGRFTWKPVTLRLRYLPTDDCDIHRICDEIIQSGLVQLYQVDGKTYAHIPTFKQHQVINNREADSVIPGIESRDCDATVTRESGGSGEGRKEGKGREDKDSYESSSTTTVDCPHQQIIESYEEILPTLPKVRRDLWAGSQAAEALKARWREDPKRQDITWWRKLFERIRDCCPHLLGHSGENPNTGKVWHADLRWIVKRENFTKILEGRYVDQRAA